MPFAEPLTRVRVALIAAVAAVGIAALAGNLLAGGAPKAGAAALRSDPAPPLYTAAMVASLAAEVAAAERRADAVARTWLQRHPSADAKAFTAMAVRSVGPPPARGTRPAELQRLRGVLAGRTAPEATAALWLEVHGKKDVWLLFADQYRQLYGDAGTRHVRRLVKQTYALAKAVAGTAKARYRRPAPYVVDPSLNALNKAKFAGAVRYSYPSKHAVIASAEAAVLTAADPLRGAEVSSWEAQIDYSRLVGGGHYASDITAGAFLGRLVADYQLALAGR